MNNYFIVLSMFLAFWVLQAGLRNESMKNIFVYLTAGAILIWGILILNNVF